MRLLCVLFIAMAACAAKQPAPTPLPTAPAAVSPGSSTAGDLPVAQYLGSDEPTGARVFELLHASGIESSAGGSLGYSVWVSGADRAKARQVLLAAASSECLAITIFDDQGSPMPGTRPARC